ncbi:D(2)-like dopamine receptor [Dendronephthya gigantea]|uniref:D(2)-like dopamine receptor n=1 Tax=Dendronephthya gigantea TaxID=151771 RepID=UPI00106C7118|nr:D(2)-like dopamine receptor [Dendronephthya gigantea]XP_028405871.1 D(2)-like dopamine receptor [Dendronephthya gigantea]
MVNITASLNCSTNTLTHPQHSKLTVASLIIMAVVIFIENITVCALFAANQKLRITTNVFVISLAISDLFVAVLFVPVYLATPVSHQANLYVVTFLLFTSLFNLCGVTYDRYHAILQPLTYRAVFTSWRIALLLFAIWFLPILLILLPATWSGEDLKTRKTIDRVYLGFMVLIVFAACAIISKVYFSIFKAIRRQLRMTRYVKGMFAPSEISSMTSIEKQSSPATTVSSLRAESPSIAQSRALCEENAIQEFDATTFGREPNAQPKRNLRKLRVLRLKKYTENVFNDVRAVKLFAIVILIFIICWLPAIIINFMVAINKLASIPQFIFDVSVYAFVANAMVNPLLFTFYKRDYRQALTEIMACSTCKDLQNKSVINFDALFVVSA